MPANKNALIRYKTIDRCLRNRYRRWTFDGLVDACYNAPVIVYDKIYYTYADPDYSITEMPLSMDDCKLIKEAITLLDNKDNLDTARVKMVLAKVKTRLTSILNFV